MDVFTFICLLFSVALALAAPSPALTVKTPLGTASGTQDPAGTYRFPVKYGSANRWAPSTVATKWALPYVFPASLSLCLKLNDDSNGSTDVTALPLACPQPRVDPSTYSEDCLSMILYVPTTLTSSSSVSTLFWFFSFPTVISVIF